MLNEDPRMVCINQAHDVWVNPDHVSSVEPVDSTIDASPTVVTLINGRSFRTRLSVREVLQVLRGD